MVRGAQVEEGIVPGGGAALLHLAEFVPDFRAGLTDDEERLGADIVMKSLTCARAPPPPPPPCRRAPLQPGQTVDAGLWQCRMLL